ncbi:LysM peptidoglycan-binding domain-containing protein [Tissierella sp.]|uniref:muramidase family protein n=1 Tax=Tissierella sp. TaxID=41274 RepID=UPI002858CAB8|nr:LysM peptidoglycan-binding domain-containing protein [Tissierella sp.]MDR7856560.1 LysM peptidoglycan-binding domain-containing protein [Tissierella sp.]
MKNKTKVAIGAMVLTIGVNGASFAAPHTVKKGESFWKISQKYGVSLDSILKENKATGKTIIYPGQTVQIPGKGDNVSVNRGAVDRQSSKAEVVNTDTKEDSKYGEYISWFGGVDKIIPRGADFKVTDFYTGKSYMVNRSVGTNHADCETLTKEDTNIMKSIWGGFSWERRPAIVEYGGRRIAASVTFMPHAGLDNVAGGITTKNRSGGYGTGINLDYIKGNGIDGHFDIHFAASTRHMDGKQDPQHQKMIKIAAGKK